MTLTNIDFYKADHRNQYPEGTELVFSNWTARKSRLEGFDHAILFGLQYYVLEYLIERWNQDFFNKPKEEAVEKYRRRMTNAGINITYEHIEKLHEHGRIPLEIWALPEGTKVPIGIPAFVMWNSHPEFFWITNYIETSISSIVWGPSTSATIANKYRKILDYYSEKTGGDPEFVGWQGHDFSYRGMNGTEAAQMSGAGHLLSFTGTDTVPAIDFLEEYYEANSDIELIGGSVPACYSEDTEILTNKGFVRFADLDEDALVAQYHENGEIDFVEPTAYYADEYKGPMARIFSDTKDRYYDVLVTPNHKMVRMDRAGEVSLQEAGTKNDIMPFHTNHRLIVSGKAQGIVNGLSAEERLFIAFQADGSFSSRKEQYNGVRTGTIPIRFSLKKERKANRLRSILEELEYEYSESLYENGYYSFRIKTPINLNITKMFDWIDLTEKNVDWAKEFIAKLAEWDGSKPREQLVSYSSTERFNVEQVQAVAAIAGQKSQMSTYKDKRENRKPIHSVILMEEKETIAVGKNPSREYVEYDGVVYCVSVPTKMIIVKHKDRVLICGNTEHSVMSLGTKTSEKETFERLITEVYPNGIVSIVSDTWDYWKVLTDYLPNLKEQIMERDGVVTIRPDSGDPVKIIVGDPDAPEGTPENKGSFEVLWEIFGGTITEKGYKLLDEHVNLIYGDSITLERAEAICAGLEAKGFVPKMILGIGSFTYNYNTRDTFGFAMKATAGVVNGELREIFKDPVTDNGTKKSAKGLLAVFETDGSFELVQQATWKQVKNCAFQHVFSDGKIVKTQTLSEIRERVNAN